MEGALRGLALLVLIALGPALAQVAGTGGWRWLGLGALAWLAAVAAKVVLSGLLHLALGTSRPRRAAALQGLLSAATELGAAAVCLLELLPRGSALHAAAFGAGAAGLELGWLLVAATVEAAEAARGDAAAAPWHVRWTFVIERAAAALGHVGSRGLVWLALGGPAWPAAVATLSFAAVDGVATLGVLEQWDWLDPRRWRRFYGFVAAVGAGELLLFLSLV